MCGIAGFIGEDKEKIERMTRSLMHRGPDGNAIWVGSGASLGHTRLAILDPRPEGDQPMWNEQKTIAVIYNGEIFNYRRLREKHNLRCRTNTDTEVLLKLFEKNGIGFVDELLGMFAFAIYDTQSQTFYLARDPSGIKPLFISFQNRTLHFASEMRALMHALPEKPQLNMTALSQYLHLQYVPGPHTLCEGIESLPPGTVLEWSGKRGEKHKFIPAKTDVPKWKSYAEYTAMLPELMDAAVRDHLISDKPVGVFLSGGMDSSIMLHHMCNHAEKPVRTYTVRFDATKEEDAKRFNTDADLAKKTAQHYGTDHHEIFLSAETCGQIYQDTARSLDQPNADAVAPAQFLLSKEAKKDVDVVLTGAGGDELFGGYPRYRVARILHALQCVPAPLRSVAGKLAGYPSDVLAMQPGPKLAERLLSRPKNEIREYVKGNWYDEKSVPALFAGRFEQLHNEEYLRQFMEFDRGLWLVDESLRLTDAVTMGSGLEARVPYLDPRMIAFAKTSPAQWHVTFKRTKALIKDTYRSILPEHLFTLPKASFYPPLAKWFRRECAPLVDETIEHQRIRELFDMEILRTQFEAHKRGAYHLHTLSSLTQLRCWFETVYDA